MPLLGFISNRRFKSVKETPKIEEKLPLVVNETEDEQGVTTLKKIIDIIKKEQMDVIFVGRQYLMEIFGSNIVVTDKRDL